MLRHSFDMGKYQKDQELVNRIRNGDKIAEFEVYKTNSSRVIRFLKKKRIGFKENVEDIEQETFLVFLRNIRNGTLIELTCSLSTYLIGIAKNLSASNFKSEQKRKSTEIENSFFQATQRDTDDSLTHEARLRIVESALSGIGENCYKILYATIYHKTPHKELANQLAYQENYIKTLKERCMKRLKELVIQECKRKGIWYD